MKKTVTANIAGTVFHIEEDAYEQLQRYLAGIRANFSGSPGAEEIMADIEARIAELFTERLKGRDVVTLTDVEDVRTVMGRPEDFAGEDANTTGGAGVPPPPPGPRGPRRFMRDPDDKWAGGLLGGLGAYIGMDPIWLRIAFIVVFLAGWGTPFILYLLLWILVPKATTAAEKLQMRGEPVTVENIKRVVEEGAEKFKQGGERVAGEARDLGKDWAPRARNVGSSAAVIIGKLVGVALILIAFSLLLGLITALIGGSWSLWSATWSSDDVGLMELGGLVFSSEAHAIWFGIGVFILLAVPVIGLFLAGFRLLLDTRTPKWLGWSLAILWFGALVPAIITGLDLASDFRRENSVRSEIPLAQPSAGIIYLDALAPVDSVAWSIRYDDDEVDVDFNGMHVENGTVSGAWAELDVTRSPDSLYHLVVVRAARARNAKTALDRAEHINVAYRQDGDALLVSPVVSYSAEDKFRAQNVHFTLQVPLGKSVFLRHGSSAIIYDIENVTNTFDREMLGRTWTMTPQGLEDPKTPREKRSDGENVTPADTTNAGPVAATVWRGPRPAKVARPRRVRPTRPAVVTAPTTEHVQLPNLFQLLSRTISI